ncbi:hypothetical protein [Actinokineospora sp. UTMC 2448]|uniref:hypothetical protein n=1 Tax=Actinokineospora sp. UTMC 2448 TaxID=2268449 RepID=UPI00216482A2|nr:hypothetical protein [Actinokineospora sp. UTMC 2448]
MRETVSTSSARISSARPGSAQAGRARTSSGRWILSSVEPAETRGSVAVITGLPKGEEIGGKSIPCGRCRQSTRKGLIDS